MDIHEAAKRMAKFQPASAGGNAYGRPNFRGDADSSGAGRLNDDECNRYMADRNERDFIVYSYGTPIAWHTPGGWYFVQQKFSISTTRHQTAIRSAVAQTARVSA